MYFKLIVTLHYDLDLLLKPDRSNDRPFRTFVGYCFGMNSTVNNTNVVNMINIADNIYHNKEQKPLFFFLSLKGFVTVPL